MCGFDGGGGGGGDGFAMVEVAMVFGRISVDLRKRVWKRVADGFGERLWFVFVRLS